MQNDISVGLSLWGGLVHQVGGGPCCGCLRAAAAACCCPQRFSSPCPEGEGGKVCCCCCRSHRETQRKGFRGEEWGHCHMRKY
ncbi:hypothetical protein GE21DRAFT_1041817 [Neurospora crassa]|nr:hypothetical protein GE21DRAFT_1041817 [Neurospora crassa]